MKSIDSLIQQCDSWIKEGRPHEVSKALSSFNTARVAREWRLPLAKICRRAGLLSLGLKLLGRIILTDRYKVQDEPTPSELTEYAVLLQRSGALSEALEKLSRVDSRQVPEALLNRAFIHFARWEFDSAIPHLKAYLQSELTPYEKAMGQANLAFALLENRQIEEAFHLLDSIVYKSSSQLQSSIHTLRGQGLLRLRKFHLARAEFEAAKPLVSSIQTNDQFFALKWRLILEGLENKDPQAFENLRHIALKQRQWEARRDADLFSLKVDYNRERFVHLYFGTPYPAFRSQFALEQGDVPEQPIYVLGKKSAPRMDLRTGLIDDREVFNPGYKCHQLIDALLYDLYRPSRMAGLFSRMFPGEQFDILSSPHRVRQLISRTRSILRKERIPIEIAESRGFYSLNICGNFSFRIPLERQQVNLPDLHFEQLKSAFGQAAGFSAQEAQERLKLSPATIHRLLHRGMSEGKVERVGQAGRAAVYMIKQNSVSQDEAA
jgi:predicted negative regulator of RcsB-dependent stress response